MTGIRVKLGYLWGLFIVSRSLFSYILSGWRTEKGSQLSLHFSHEGMNPTHESLILMTSLPLKGFSSDPIRQWLGPH